MDHLRDHQDVLDLKFGRLKHIQDLTDIVFGVVAILVTASVSVTLVVPFLATYVPLWFAWILGVWATWSFFGKIFLLTREPIADGINILTQPKVIRLPPRQLKTS